jgi:cytochrome bd-type quinol oxidase subunit 2
MRNFLFRLAAVLVCVLVAMVLTPLVLGAQTPENPFVPGTTADKVFNWYTVLYGAVITVATYVQGAFFPRAGAIPKVAVRYILIAVVAAALFITLGWANALSIFIGFIGSALTYDKLLVPIGIKTPKPIGS